jgi:UDP-glucose 4-epimerase
VPQRDASEVQKVAVTGGSGLLGTLIVHRLLDQPDVNAVVSIDCAPPRLASEKLKFVELDVRDERLTQHLSQCSAVVHCAFLVTSNVRDRIFYSVNVEGSKNVLRAAAAAGVKTIVHLSSMMAYGSVSGHPVPITEETPRIYQPDFPYAGCKYEVESFLDEFEATHPNISVCRLRPAVLLGRNVTHILGWLLRRRVVPWQGGAPLAVVSDEDVADLAILALQKHGRGAFNASADDLLNAREIAERFGMFVLVIPRFLVAAYQALDWCLKKIGLHLAYDACWFTKTQGVALVMSSARARKELGWSPRCPTAAAVLAHFLEVAPRRLDLRLAAAFALLRRQGRRLGPEFNDRSAKVHLCVTGEYGGDFSLLLAERRLLVRRRAPPFPSGTIRVSSTTLLQMLAGEADIDHACRQADVSFEGNGAFILKWMVASLADLRSDKGLWGAATRALLRPRLPSGRSFH